MTEHRLVSRSFHYGEHLRHRRLQEIRAIALSFHLFLAVSKAFPLLLPDKIFPSICPQRTSSTFAFSSENLYRALAGPLHRVCHHKNNADMPFKKRFINRNSRSLSAAFNKDPLANNFKIPPDLPIRISKAASEVLGFKRSYCVTNNAVDPSILSLISSSKNCFSFLILIHSLCQRMNEDRF